MFRATLAVCISLLSVQLAAAQTGPVSTVKDAYASWSPDGARIVFASTRSGNWDIWSIDANGENLAQLTHDEADDHYPAMSPDGTTIAFVSGRETGDFDLFLMDADGGNQRRLNRNPALDVHPVWHPDGHSLLFNSARADPEAEGLDIYRIGTDGSGIRQLSSGPMNESLASYTHDGERIIFETQVPDETHPLGYRVEIASMPASGGEPTLLTEHFATDAYPASHPQSGKIVFASSRSRAGARRFQLYAMDSDGRNVVRLIESPFTDARPFISPDGTEVAFTRSADLQENGAMSIVIRSLDCSGVFCGIAEEGGR